jgi:asparagine synthase (glutamine-hydrolysing)
MARYSTTVLGRAQGVAARLARIFGQMVPAGSLRRRIDNLATRKSPLSTWIQSHSVFTYEIATRMIGLEPGPSSEARIAAVLDEMRPDWMSESAIGLSCLLDTRVYMISQLLRDADATSMASSLELRVPLVDLQVAGFSRTCADEYKLSRGGGKGNHYQASGAKRVLIAALQDVLPPAIVNRPKRGFALPLDQWMRKQLAPLAKETCGPEAIRQRGLVDPAYANELWRQANSGVGGTHYPKLWSLMLLELWCRAVIDAPLTPLRSAPVALSH